MRPPWMRPDSAVTGEYGLPLQVPLDLALMTRTETAPGTQACPVTLGELLPHGLTVIAVGDLGRRRSRRWLTRLKHSAARLEGHRISVVAVHKGESAGPRRLTAGRSLAVMTDPSGALAAAAGARGPDLSLVLVLDSRGNVCWRHKGQREGRFPPVAVVESVAVMLATMTS